MTKKQKLVVVAIVVSVILLVTIASLPFLTNRTAQYSGQTPITVMIPWQFGPEFAFLDEGSSESGPFPKYNLGLTVRPSKGSHEVVAAFSNPNPIQFAFLGGDSLVRARKKGIPIQALFCLYPKSPAVIVSKSTSRIVTPADLIGKKIGVISASTTYPQFRVAMLNAFKPNNPPEPNKDFFEVEAREGGLAQLLNGEIDALTQMEHFAPLQMADKGISASVIQLRDYGVDIYGTVFAASDEIIAKDPELVQRVVSAMLDSINRTIASPDATTKTFLQRRDSSTFGTEKFARSQISATIRLITDRRNENDPVGHLDKIGWQSTESTLISATLVENTIRDMDYYFDDRFLKKHYESPIKGAAK